VLELKAIMFKSLYVGWRITTFLAFLIFRIFECLLTFPN